MATPDGSSSESEKRVRVWIGAAVTLAILAGALGTWRFAGGWTIAFGSMAEITPSDLTYTASWTSSAKKSPTVKVVATRTGAGMRLNFAVRNPDSMAVDRCSVKSLTLENREVPGFPLEVGKIAPGATAVAAADVPSRYEGKRTLKGRVEIAFDHADGSGTAADTADVEIR